MTDSLMETRAVKDLLMKVSGLNEDSGNLRLKRIVHRVVGDLFRTIEEFDVQPDEFWTAMSYLTRLGQSSEVGLAGAGPRPGDVPRHAHGPGGARRPGSKAARRAPSKVRSMSPVRPFQKVRPGSTMAANRARCCSWKVRSATLTASRSPAPSSMSGTPTRWAAIRFFDPAQPKYNFRRRIETDAEGRYRFRCLLPSGYACPPGGPTQQLLDQLGRHGHRPAHIHFFVARTGLPQADNADQYRRRRISARRLRLRHPRRTDPRSAARDRCGAVRARAA